MKKVVWRDNQVISIETRRRDENRTENVYVLAQMIDRCYLIVFNLFNTDNKWENVNLNEVPILFCTAITRQFYRNSNAYKQNIEPLLGYKRPNRRIHPFTYGGREVTLWEGTSDEMKVIVLGSGGGQLIEGTFGKHKVIIPDIDFSDDETIDKYELTNIRIYAEFNERLYLCYKFGKNVDPLKDLTFNRPIPLEYKEYMIIMMS